MIELGFEPRELIYTFHIMNPEEPNSLKEETKYLLCILSRLFQIGKTQVTTRRSMKIKVVYSVNRKTNLLIQVQISQKSEGIHM
jgi:hypothetical protein